MVPALSEIAGTTFVVKRQKLVRRLVSCALLNVSVGAQSQFFVPYVSVKSIGHLRSGKAIARSSTSFACSVFFGVN